MNPRRPRELYAALAAVIFITLAYFGMNLILGEVPAASGFYGHSMGVVGFGLMLMTETLYSLRKRSRLARWGQMSNWLQFHIFTGIVGPYLVLLHSSWKFNGIAGVLTLLTVVIVVSGFIGRYIYTAVPRSADGLALEAEELESQIAAADGRVRAWVAANRSLPPALVERLVGQASGAGGWGLGRSWSSWLALRQVEPGLRREAQALAGLIERRDTLRRQIGSLQTARRLLATWHTVHIPIGLGLFALAFVHIGAAIYYALL
jgi:hypothetical protein